MTTATETDGKKGMKNAVIRLPKIFSEKEKVTDASQPKADGKKIYTDTDTIPDTEKSGMTDLNNAAPQSTTIRHPITTKEEVTDADR